MRKHGFHERLAIVERAVDSERVHIGRRHAGHLPALHIRHAAMRVEDENIDIIDAGERFDGRRARIARGGADDCRAPRRLAQRLVHQQAKQLHRHILECERRTVKQFQHEKIGIELDQRRHGRMAEAGPGGRQHGAQGDGRNVRREGRDDLLGDLGKRLAAERANCLRLQPWPCRGHIKPAIPRQTGQQGGFERQGGCLSPR